MRTVSWPHGHWILSTKSFAKALAWSVRWLSLDSVRRPTEAPHGRREAIGGYLGDGLDGQGEGVGLDDGLGIEALAVLRDQMHRDRGSSSALSENRDLQNNTRRHDDTHDTSVSMTG